MSGKRYPEEFKTEAVKQVVDRGYSVASVATRLDITTHSLYAWIKKYGPDSSTNKEQSDAQAEIRRLQKELKRVTDERDILKKAAAYFAAVRLRYAFIRDNSCCWPVRLLCRVLDVHPSGFYAWLCQRQDYWPFFAIFNVRYWSLMLSACRHFIITDWRGVFCQHSRFAFFL